MKTGLESKYPVPEGFRLTPCPDVRSDEEIATVLQTFRPVDPSSDKNVWTFWHTGWSGMRPWCRRNVINWVRRLGPQWTVRVVDSCSNSPNNWSRFIPSSLMPEALNDGTIQCPPQHLSDLVRLPLLIVHGGVWMDAGMLLIRHLDDICWAAIESEDSPYEMAGNLIPLRVEEGPILNGFIAARRENPLVQRWHSVYCALWEGQTSSQGFQAHPLLAHLPPYDLQYEVMNSPRLPIPNDTLGEYLAHFICSERVRLLQDPNDGFNGAEYFATKVLLFRAADSLYYAERITEWDGRKQSEMLASRVLGADTDGNGDADTETQKTRQEAQSFVGKLLANCALMKLSHGPPGGIDGLASIWDKEEHSNDDVAEGTYAEYLRCASAFWEPVERRPLESVRLGMPKELQVFKAGLLEPITPA